MRTGKRTAFFRLLLALTATTLLFSSACSDSNDDDNNEGTDTGGVADTGQSDSDTGGGEDGSVGEVQPDVVEDEGPDPCQLYPCVEYGTALGDVIADLSWEAASDSARELAGDDGMVDMHDVYQSSTTNGGELRGLFVWHTTGWCPYCRDEAPQLQAIYDSYADQGILFIVAVDESNNPGTPATVEFAESYGDSNGFTFPVVAGGFESNYWPPADVASGEIGVPLHMFIDATTMQIYGRYSGAAPAFIGLGIDPLVEGVSWGEDGVRVIDFDCAPGTGTEEEPNDLNSPEEADGLPYELTGAICPGTIADGILLDQDIVNLGRLTAGTVIDVQMEPTGSSEVYPFTQLFAVSGGNIALVTMGPAIMEAEKSGRQWVIEQTGEYLVGVSEGRGQSGQVYGDRPVPEEDACCVGGADYTYSLDVTEFELALTDGALEVGDTEGAFADGNLKVYSLAVTAGTTYDVRLAADDGQLDPYLILFDPEASALISSNDDEDYSGGNINSYLEYEADADGTIWIVAGYWGIWFYDEPSFTIEIE